MLTADWYKRGACQGYPLELFFGYENENVSQRKRREKAAKQVCATCTVIEQCLDAGDGQEGIWGGLTAAERRSKHRVKITLERPFVRTETNDANIENRWMVIDFHGQHAIWQRDNPDNWHGTEWAVVKNDEIQKIFDDLNNTYLEFGKQIHS